MPCERRNNNRSNLGSIIENKTRRKRERERERSVDEIPF
jgi:hypothetical protein